jgi:zinc/manganese transport system substrate-binding protein/zinc transport system substrate-binding protein
LAKSAEKGPRALAASYPVWLFARYLSYGRDYFQVELLTNPGTGCPHDFAPTPRDLERLSQARVLIKNGLGLETYLDRALKVASKDVLIIDASLNSPTLPLNWGRLELTDQSLTPKAPDDLGPLAPNPHIFSSPRLATLMTANIAEGLSKADPDGRAHYQERRAAFQADMDYLMDIAGAFERSRVGYRAIVSHGFMDYLARDLGLLILADIEPAPEVAPSAARLKALADFIKSGEVSAVLTEPTADLAMAKTLAAEGGIQAAVVDPITAGPADPDLDFYQKVAKENLFVLSKIFPANRGD